MEKNKERNWKILNLLVLLFLLSLSLIVLNKITQAQTLTKHCYHQPIRNYFGSVSRIFFSFFSSLLFYLH